MKKNLVNTELAAYLAAFAPSLDSDLRELQRKAYTEGLPIISNDVVSFLSVVLALKKPQTILEIGCCIGFSALLMARQTQAKITTIDRYPLMINRARENFAKLDKHKQIELIEGDAAIILPELAAAGKRFDMIFLDAGKGQYNRFFPYCMELLTPGGVLLADDVLQGGSVAWDLDKIEKRQRTTHRNLNEFLQNATNTDDLTSTILPIGDGLFVCARVQTTNRPPIGG